MTRKRLFKRVVLSALVLIVLIVVAGLIVLHSRAFQRYVLAKAVSGAEQATGSSVQIGDLTFDLFTLRVDLYRVALRGSEPASNPPLLWMNHVGANLKIISLFDGRVGLSNLEINHPVVHFVVDAKGRSNLPSPPRSNTAQSNGSAEVFRLAVDRFALRQGEIYVNDRQIPLKADLRRLQMRAHFEPSTAEYRGSLSYQTGEIQVSHYEPLAHNLDLHFSAESTKVRLEPLIVRSGNSRIAVQATVENYTHPAVTGSYSAALATAELARVLKVPIQPAGRIDTTAHFQYQSVPGRSLLNSMSVTGRLSSPVLSLRSREVQGRIAAIRGQYRLEHGNLTAKGLEAEAFGGRVTAVLTIRNLSGAAPGNATASIQSVSLAALRAALPSSQWAKFPVQGNLNATINAAWHGPAAGLRAHSDANLVASLGPLHPSAQPTTLQADLHATYEASVKSVAIEHSLLRTPNSEINLNGPLSDHSDLAITARSGDLHATDQLIAQVRKIVSPSPKPVRTFGLAGTALFQGTIRGSTQSPALTGRLSADRLSFQGAFFPHVQTQLNASSSRLSLTSGELQAARGSARFQAAVGLKNWTYNPSSPASLQLSADNMSVADLAHLAQKPYPIKGVLSADVSVAGSLSHPAGKGTVHILKGEAWKQPFQSLTIHFNGTGTAVQSDLSVQTPAGNAYARLTYNPQGQAYNGEAKLERIHLAKLQAFKQARVPITGVVSASLRGQGTLKAPQGQASLAIPSLVIGHQQITSVSSQVTVADHVATFSFTSNFAGTPAHLGGTVRLENDFEMNAKLDTGIINAGPLLVSYIPSAPGEIQFTTQLRGWLKGPLKEPRRIEAQLQIPNLRIAHQSLQLSSASTITATYRDGVLVLNPAEIRGNQSDFRAQARIPLVGNAPIQAAVNGTVDLHLVQMIQPDWSSSGQFRVNLNASGSRSHPSLQGQVQLVNAAVEPSNAPIGVHDLNATIRLAGGRAEIVQFNAKAGEGTIEASGSVAYTQGAAFNLALSADHVRIRYPEGVREVIDSKLRFTGSPESALIAGEVTIDELSLTPSFDLVNFANQFNVMAVPSGSTTGFTHDVKLNVALRSARELSLSSRQLHMRGSVDLRAEGTLADPVIVGRTVIGGGELFFNNRRYQVESGVIDFLNPVSTEPVVNVRVFTTVDQYRLTLTFVGPFDHMRTTYSSDPSLSQADIIHLLVTGQPSEAAGTGLGAQSILAQGVAGQVSSSVEKLTGITSLSIDPQVGGHGAGRGARIAVQQRVTSKLAFTISVDTSTSQDDAVQLQYHFTRRWSVEALRDQAGGYSLEIRSHKDF
ncbi:MAG TPA: translocation/assembly module TamB domain-containing protein [Terriglobales bacterium]|nr:translocation/assembly module TamB domain-containing protein [Terriglobales bacterium]